MPLDRAFTYNTGAAPSGTTKVSDITVKGYTSIYNSGYNWIPGPDESLGYVITYRDLARTRPVKSNAYTSPLIFYRSLDKTESSFVQLTNNLLGTSVSTGDDANNVLRAAGYWSSWGLTIEGLSLYYDFSHPRCYNQNTRTIYNLVGNSEGYVKNEVYYNGSQGVLRTMGYNSGAQFNVGDRIDINTTAGGVDRFGQTNSFTFEFWVKYNSGSGKIFSTGSAGTGTGNSDQCIWQFWIENGTWYWWNSGGGGTNALITGFNSLNAGVWTHLAATYTYNEAGNNVIRIYKNGSLDVMGSISTAAHSAIDRSGDSNMQYTLGGGYASSCYNSNSANEFGSFSCYNRALTASEIARNYNTTKFRF
jgi:hypothetical protein